MKVETTPVKLQTGSIVRIRGQAFIVGEMNEDGWRFSSKDGKQYAQYTFLALRHMLRTQQLTSDSSYRALSRNVQEAIELDWGSFTILEQRSAYQKQSFVDAIDKLPPRCRDKRKYLEHLIQETNRQAADPFAELPTFRRVRDWYRRWVAAGRDIRALVDFHRKKGNRAARLQDWEREEIDQAIEEVYKNELRGSEKATWRRARDRILLRARKERLTISVGAKEALGKNAVGRALARRELYPLIANRFGRAHANRTIKTLGVGPQGDYPLAEVEVDHALLDIIVVHKNGQGRLGRPWLTALIDRYSRLIIGFAISFAPPSWVAVMEALRVAVLPKDELLASLGGDIFQFEWDCFGTPDCLFCDNGREFRSESMRATQAVLGMRIVDLEPGRPDLKGKIERWFRTLNQSVVHLQPGTTFSNPQERLRYNSEGEAVLTLADLRWIVTKYVVDVYNQSRHSATGDIPAERWKRGTAQYGEKPPPPKELIAPLIGLVVNRKLRREGVRYNHLRWNSNAFQSLRNRIGANVDVLIRVDPLDLRHAFILDEETASWVEGDLIAETEVEKLTLSQYEHLRERIGSENVFDEERALKIAQAGQEIRDFVDNKKKGAGLVPKPVARFVTEGRKPAEHIHQERWDPNESNRPLGCHDSCIEIPKALAPDTRGPYRQNIFPASEASMPTGAMRGAKPGPTVEVQAESKLNNAVPNVARSRLIARTVFPGRRRQQ